MDAMLRNLDRVALVAYSAVGVLQLASILMSEGTLRNLTQALLMLVLLAYAHAPLSLGARTVPMPARDRIGLTAALLLSWAGDFGPRLVAPDSEFPSMVLFFLAAQLAWAWELASRRERSVFARNRIVMLAYAAAGCIVVSACLPGAGVFTGLLFLYALAVLATGVLATGYGWPGTLAGLLFMVSNAFVGLYKFVLALDPGDPVRGIVIMAPYMAAQSIMVWAVRRAIVHEAQAEETVLAVDAAAAEASPSSLDTPGLPPAIPGPETRASSRI